MLREDQSRSNRITIEYVRDLVRDYPEDRQIVEEIVDKHIRAKLAFNSRNSDETMINLIGTWSRFTRIMYEMDDKYGRRE